MTGSAKAREPMLLTLAFAALLGAVTYVSVETEAVQDYVAYKLMWEWVLAGKIPWLQTHVLTPQFNMYPPLFQALALPFKLHPYLPKVMISWAWVFSAGWLVRFHARSPSATPLALAAMASFLFLSPYFWLESSVFGHFDVLIGVCMLGAVHSFRERREAHAGLWLAVGTLVKTFPVILFPLFLLNGRRIHWRFAGTFAACMAVGYGVAYFVWGWEVFLPFRMMGQTESILSIYSSMQNVFGVHLEQLSAWFILAILMSVYVAHWIWRIELSTAVLLASLGLLIFFRTGGIQYQSALFLVVPHWIITQPGGIPRSRSAVIATWAYLGWFSVFDLIFYLTRGFSEGGYAMFWDYQGFIMFGLGSLAWVSLFRDRNP